MNEIHAVLVNFRPVVFLNDKIETGHLLISKL
jgi:hypothetical protein